MKNIRVVCMGDSLTEGYGIAQNRRWSNLLAKELDLPIINSGISGDTTAGMLARFKPMVLDHQPSHVIIMGGTNDIYMDLPNNVILSNIRAMIRYARYYGIESIIGIPPPIFETADRSEDSIYISPQKVIQRIAAFQEALIQFAVFDERKVIDFRKDMTADVYLEDGLHPNEAGQLVMMVKAKECIASLRSDW